MAKQPQTESSGYVHSSPSSHVPIESNPHRCRTCGRPASNQMILPCSRQLVCRVPDNYFIMRERLGFQLKEYENSLPKALLESKSLNKLRKSLDNAKNMRLDLFRMRKSVSNTSLECHLHHSVTANPNRPMFPPQQMPLLRSVGNSVLTNRLDEITRKLVKAK